MNQVSFNTFTPAAILLAGVLLISGVREQHVVPPLAPMRQLPSTFASLPSRSISVPEEERRIAGMSDYVMREFLEDSTPKFSVYVGYYDRQVQGKTIHSPKNCLPGAGWEILSTERIGAPGASPAAGTVNRVLLANKGVRALVYYWYQGRGRVEANEFTVKWNLLRDAAMHGRTEEALVRIVVPISGASAATSANDPTIAAADSLARAVAAELLPAVTRVMPVAQWGASD